MSRIVVLQQLDAALLEGGDQQRFRAAMKLVAVGFEILDGASGDA